MAKISSHDTFGRAFAAPAHDTPGDSANLIKDAATTALPTIVLWPRRPPVGLLVTMKYCRLFHILFNLCAISIFLHVAIRLMLLAGDLITLMQCSLRGVETVIGEMWMR